MPNYNNAVIYKISQRDGKGEIYIGSTCNLKQRKNGHKTACNLQNGRKYQYTLYEHIRANGGWINWKVEILEEYPCESKAELEIREGQWIENERPSLNQYRPGGIALAGGVGEYKRQWAKDNAERLGEKARQYRQDNTDRLSEYQRQWYQENAERVRESRRQYQQDNADRIREYKRQWYQEIAERRKERITCECGKVIQRAYLTQHRKTKYHLTHTPTGAPVPMPGGGLGGVASGVGTNIEGKTVANPIATAAISARGSEKPCDAATVSAISSVVFNPVPANLAPCAKTSDEVCSAEPWADATTPLAAPVTPAKASLLASATPPSALAAAGPPAMGLTPAAISFPA